MTLHLGMQKSRRQLEQVEEKEKEYKEKLREARCAASHLEQTA